MVYGKVFRVKMLLMLNVMVELLDVNKVLNGSVISILEIRMFAVMLYLVNQFYGFCNKL